METVLGERGAEYGFYRDNAFIAMRVVESIRGPFRHPLDACEYGALLAAHKMARMASGGIAGDSVVDLRGYNRLVHDACDDGPATASILADDPLRTAPGWHDLPEETRAEILTTLTKLQQVYTAKTPREVAVLLKVMGLIDYE